jgi:Na+/H+ antiporter NhaC
VSLAPLGIRLEVRAPELAADTLRVVVRDLTSGTTLHDADATRAASDEAFALPQLDPTGYGRRRLEVQVGGAEPSQVETRVFPGWISLLPPLLAIGLAIVLRQVVVALFVGVWVGALFVFGFDVVGASLRVVDHYALGRVVDRSNASLLLFTLLLGGMVGVIGRSGGARGIANAVTHFATTPRRGQLTTWTLGLLVFFDDYANTLLVGPTMRPIADKLRISREKLAFIVDSTSAPVASMALISSWIGVEVGYIHDQFVSLQIDRDAYWTFVQTIPYRFYPILMLFTGFLLVSLGRDFGPMRRAELRARTRGKVLAEGATPATDFEEPALRAVEGRPHRWINAALPLLTVLVTVLVGLYVTGRSAVAASGESQSLRSIIGNADSFRALLWGSFVGGVVAIGLAVGGRVLSLAESMQAWIMGMRSMLYALIILVLAWSLGEVCKSDLHTGEYLVGVLGPTLRPALLPFLVFLVAAFTSFATGSSWGTMGILFPLVVTLAHGIAPDDSTILLGSISSILAGSVWGDHCSPISDTTILSSLATSCDHLDHVRTQIPYAVVVAAVGMLFGNLGTAFGWYGPWVAMLLGASTIVGIVFLVGKRVPEVAAQAEDAQPVEWSVGP